MKVQRARHAQIDLESPVLLVCLNGWVDAGGVLDRTIRAVLDGPSILLASFDADELINYRSRRPIMHVDSGINTGLDWPTIEILACKDLDGRDVVVLAGAEPDRAWRGFSEAVVAMATEFGVRMAFTLGAYPAATPHTREIALSAVGTTPKLVERVGYLDGKLDVPAGVHAALERACATAAIPSVGLWAPVPHYAAGEPFPAAVGALLRGLEQVGDRRFLTGEIQAEAESVNDRLDTLLAGDDERARLVGNLESHADNVARTHPSKIPTGDQLAAQFRAFLDDNDD